MIWCKIYIPGPLILECKAHDAITTDRAIKNRKTKLNNTKQKKTEYILKSPFTYYYIIFLNPI